ncbi:MAG: anaerobic ribonucleoside-triphosphate reductase activating protein [Promethearchaeota archaeon]
MGIGGFQKHTLSDYPGKVSCIVFFSGCNFRCPWCQNGSLVDGTNEVLSEKHILSEIEKTQEWLDGVVISGGEPTISPEIVDFCTRIKEKGLLIKLDTNGSRPTIIQELMDKKLVDYIAMDIKTALNEYDTAIGVKFDSDNIGESIQLIMSGTVDYEFRSTVVPEFFKIAQFNKILQIIQGAKRYVLQNYDPTNRMFQNQCKERYSTDILEEWAKIGEDLVQECFVR